jgi:DNA-binding response OmpR family regulator
VGRDYGDYNMIWIVADHHETRNAVTSLLRDKGYEVTDMQCGGAVGKHLTFRTPLLIIIDCGMADSFDTLLTVRTQARARPIPVVMFSIDDPNMREKCLMAGADAFVVKGSLDWADMLTEVVRFVGPLRG